MPAFPRTFVPQGATWPEMPTGFESWGQSGKGQFRAMQQVGRRWTETWGPLDDTDVAVQAFLAQVEDFWHQRTILDVDHRSLRALFGVTTGTPLVNGASQTGSSINTDGWPVSTSNVLRAGDVIKFAGLNLVYRITADASSNGSGQAALAISPPIFTGGSPADGAALTRNDPAGSVLFRAVIAQWIPPASSRGSRLLTGMAIMFREAP